MNSLHALLVAAAVAFAAAAWHLLAETPLAARSAEAIGSVGAADEAAPGGRERAAGEAAHVRPDATARHRPRSESTGREGPDGHATARPAGWHLGPLTPASTTHAGAAGPAAAAADPAAADSERERRASWLRLARPPPPTIASR